MSYKQISQHYTNGQYAHPPNWADPCNPCRPYETRSPCEPRCGPCEPRCFPFFPPCFSPCEKPCSCREEREEHDECSCRKKKRDDCSCKKRDDDCSCKKKECIKICCKDPCNPCKKTCIKICKKKPCKKPKKCYIPVPVPVPVPCDPCYQPWTKNWPWVTRSWEGQFTH